MRLFWNSAGRAVVRVGRDWRDKNAFCNTCQRARLFVSGRVQGKSALSVNSNNNNQIGESIPKAVTLQPLPASSYVPLRHPGDAYGAVREVEEEEEEEEEEEGKEGDGEEEQGNGDDRRDKLTGLGEVKEFLTQEERLMEIKLSTVIGVESSLGAFVLEWARRSVDIIPGVEGKLPYTAKEVVVRILTNGLKEEEEEHLVKELGERHAMEIANYLRDMCLKGSDADVKRPSLYGFLRFTNKCLETYREVLPTTDAIQLHRTLRELEVRLGLRKKKLARYHDASLKVLFKLPNPEEKSALVYPEVNIIRARSFRVVCLESEIGLLGKNIDEQVEILQSNTSRRPVEHVFTDTFQAIREVHSSVVNGLINSEFIVVGDEEISDTTAAEDLHRFMGDKAIIKHLVSGTMRWGRHLQTPEEGKLNDVKYAAKMGIESLYGLSRVKLVESMHQLKTIEQKVAKNSESNSRFRGLRKVFDRKWNERYLIEEEMHRTTIKQCVRILKNCVELGEKLSVALLVPIPDTYAQVCHLLEGIEKENRERMVELDSRFVHLIEDGEKTDVDMVRMGVEKIVDDVVNSLRRAKQYEDLKEKKDAIATTYNRFLKVKSDWSLNLGEALVNTLNRLHSLSQNVDSNNINGSELYLDECNKVRAAFLQITKPFRRRYILTNAILEPLESIPLLNPSRMKDYGFGIEARKLERLNNDLAEKLIHLPEDLSDMEQCFPKSLATAIHSTEFWKFLKTGDSGVLLLKDPLPAPLPTPNNNAGTTAAATTPSPSITPPTTMEEQVPIQTTTCVVSRRLINTPTRTGRSSRVRVDKGDKGAVPKKKEEPLVLPPLAERTDSFKKQQARSSNVCIGEFSCGGLIDGVSRVHSPGTDDKGAKDTSKMNLDYKLKSKENNIDYKESGSETESKSEIKRRLIAVMSSYENAVGGALKLKGLGKVGGGVGKTKGKKKKKTKGVVTGTGEGVVTGGRRDGEEKKKKREEGEEGEEEEEGKISPEEGSSGKEGKKKPQRKTLTEAEWKFQQRKMEKEKERIMAKASKTHKEKVEELNAYLDRMSEHYDIPKVSWTK
eukprot:Nk52_evm13s246 gene=Nk52_evmTU13s246